MQELLVFFENPTEGKQLRQVVPLQHLNKRQAGLYAVQQRMP
jgi:hypothetical protein